jgi:hypothetical protein
MGCKQGERSVVRCQRHVPSSDGYPGTPKNTRHRQDDAKLGLLNLLGWPVRKRHLVVPDINWDNGRAWCCGATPLVMYVDQLIEGGTSWVIILQATEHPYTQILVASVPIREQMSEQVGEQDGPGVDRPRLVSPPSGCRVPPAVGLPWMSVTYGCRHGPNWAGVHLARCGLRLAAPENQPVRVTFGPPRCQVSEAHGPSRHSGSTGAMRP